MSIYKFPREVKNKLKHYIYLYLDPDTNEVFYVGKGSGNRAFAHLDGTSESEMACRIAEIWNNDNKPKIEILVHGLEDDEVAKRVEAAVIDLIGVQNLTNKVRGLESREYGRMEVTEVIASYRQEEAVISEPAILIRINELYRYGMTEIELYDATRGIWRISLKRVKKVDYAMAVYGGLIREVYKIEAWFPAGLTLTTRDICDRDVKGRKEFVGTIAPSEIRNKYKGKSVRKYFKKGDSYPVRYVNS